MVLKNFRRGSWLNFRAPSGESSVDHTLRFLMIAVEWIEIIASSEVRRRPSFALEQTCTQERGASPQGRSCYPAFFATLGGEGAWKPAFGHPTMGQW